MYLHVTVKANSAIWIIIPWLYNYYWPTPYLTLIADVAISKRPLLFIVWTQLRLCSHQTFYKIFTRKQLLPKAQLHFRDDQQRAFGISNISN